MSQRDLLGEGVDVVRWLGAAGFECEPARHNDQLLVTARRLREAVYSLAVARVTGQALPEDSRSVLNDAASQPATPPLLDHDVSARLSGRAEALLAFVAREAVLLLGGTVADRVRQCEGDGCAILFLDASRKGERRWCSMSACGNRHKAAAFRQRNRNAPS